MMKTSHSSKLPEEVRDSLKRILQYAGNEEAAEQDPDKVLAMLLFQIERHLTVDPMTSIGYIVRKYCTPDGLVRFAHKSKEMASV